MKYFLDNWSTMETELKGKDIYLFFDYDGTLSPIAEKPELALLPQDIKSKLVTISHNPRCQLAIISGRQLEDLKQKVDIEGIMYSGNHGLEIDTPAIEYEKPVSDQYIQTLNDLRQDLIIKLAKFDGVFVEDKHLTISVHYRLLEPNLIHSFQHVFKEVVSYYLNDESFQVIGGKMVYEIRPRIAWNKGNAVSMLLKELNCSEGKNCVAFYFGDDVTDEDAFKVLEDSGVTVLIGQPKPSKAQFYLKDVNEMSIFLQKLIRYLDENKN